MEIHKNLILLCFLLIRVLQVQLDRSVNERELYENFNIINPVGTSMKGWTNGTCQLPGIDRSLNISKIKSGKWFLQYKGSTPISTPPHVEPFSLLFRHMSCTYIIISHFNDELVMEHRCRDKSTEDFKFQNCRYLFKFTADKQIKYEISYRCSLVNQIKGVLISNTDYDNYILIRGCVLRKALKNGELYQRETQMVLVRNPISDNIFQKILNSLHSATVEYDFKSILRNTNIDKLSEKCNCSEYTCLKPQKNRCYPIEYIEIIEINTFTFIKYSIIVATSLISFLVCIVLVLYKYKQIRRKQIKISPDSN